MWMCCWFVACGTAAVFPKTSSVTVNTFGPPSAHPCTCRHSVGYCLIRMRISLYQGKHWCSSAIVLIVPPRSIIPIWLPFIHLCDCECTCVCLCWVSVHRCSCAWPIVPTFAFTCACTRLRHFGSDTNNLLEMPLSVTKWQKKGLNWT